MTNEDQMIDSKLPHASKTGKDQQMHLCFFVILDLIGVLMKSNLTYQPAGF